MINAFQTGDKFYSDRAFSMMSSELTAVTMHTYSAHTSARYCTAWLREANVYTVQSTHPTAYLSLKVLECIFY